MSTLTLITQYYHIYLFTLFRIGYYSLISMSGRTKDYLAFIVDGKTENRVKDFIFTNYSDIRYFTILATKTDANAIASLDLNIKYAQSLDMKGLLYLPTIHVLGEEDIIQRMKVSKDVQALIILNYPTTVKTFPIERLQKVISFCTSHDIPLIFTDTLAKEYIASIASIRGLLNSFFLISAITHGDKKKQVLSNKSSF